jgi:uncharacterized membrane protein YgdD (TMEM256/DUF423 family)
MTEDDMILNWILISILLLIAAFLGVFVIRRRGSDSDGMNFTLPDLKTSYEYVVIFVVALIALSFLLLMNDSVIYFSPEKSAGLMVGIAVWAGLLFFLAGKK